jgi:tRNA-2-methylthio-N6-dimethylallyladenosine synthase
MNFSDSERFDKVLQTAGFDKAQDFDNADLIVFNSCSVRQKAEDRILGLGKVINRMKEKNPNLVTVLTGCMAKRVWDDRGGKVVNWKWQKDLKAQMPWLDMIIETKHFNNIVNELYKNELLEVEKVEETDPFYDITPSYKSRYQAFLPISTGCDHFCSFCIVPFARGREECRSYDVIYSEFKKLIDAGYNDITLLGQIVNRWVNPKYRGKVKYWEVNTNSYHDEDGEAIDFLQLLERLDEIPGEYWLTFSSSHPLYFKDEIIEFFARAEHVRPYLHFAMQSGSDEVLKSMRRDYEYKAFRDIVMKFKETVPGMAVSTDIIVGFPGETENQFLETADAMEELEFDMAYINEYSPRTGTHSAKIPDDVPHLEKERRKEYLNEILKKTSAKQKQEEVGRILRCIPYKRTKNGTVLRTIKNRDVLVDKNVKLGDFVNVEILEANEWSLKGRLVNS